MKTYLRHLWEKLRVSLWFVPGLTVAGFASAGVLAIAVDGGWGGGAPVDVGGFVDLTPGGARTLLATSGTAIITLAGVTFSATLVALTLASGQFGPRLLRNYIRSLPSQFSMGILLGTFVLCLIVIHAVREDVSRPFVPDVAVVTAFVATLVSLGAFINFIHHLATSLQAERIVATVFRELDFSIERFFPVAAVSGEPGLAARSRGEPGESPGGRVGAAVAAESSGYLQAVDYDRLVALAVESGESCRGRLSVAPGMFVNPGRTLIEIAGMGGGDLEPGRWRDCFLVGSQRTPEQDFAYCIHELVETGLRALSAGINDPYTAAHCIDYLGAALAKVATREPPRNQWDDGDGLVRIVAPESSLEDLLETAFGQLRRASVGRPEVVLRIADALAAVKAAATETDGGDGAAVDKQARRLWTTFSADVSLTDDDRDDVARAFHTLGLARDCCKGEGSPPFPRCAGGSD